MRVLVLSAARRSVELSFLLEEEGLEPVFFPVLGEATERSRGLEASAEQLHRFAWVIAVERAPLFALLEAMQAAGTSNLVTSAQWLVSDEVSARVLDGRGATVRTPAQGKWSAAISGLLTMEDEVLVIHRAPCPEQLVLSLEALQAKVTYAKLDGWVEPEPPAALGEAGAFEAVLVHSRAAAEAWAALTQHNDPDQVHPDHAPGDACCGGVQGERRVVTLAAELKVVSGAPQVTQTLGALGVAVHETAQEPSAESLVAATVRALQARAV